MKKLIFLVPILIISFIVSVAVYASAINNTDDNVERNIDFKNYKFVFKENRLLSREYYSRDELGIDENKYVLYENYNQFQEYLSRENYFTYELYNELINDYNEDYFKEKNLLLVEFRLPVTPAQPLFKIREMKLTDDNTLEIIYNIEGIVEMRFNYCNLLIELDETIDITNLNLYNYDELNN